MNVAIRHDDPVLYVVGINGVEVDLVVGHPFEEVIDAIAVGGFPVEHGVYVRKRMGDLRVVGEAEEDHQVGQLGGGLGMDRAAKAGRHQD